MKRESLEFAATLAVLFAASAAVPAGKVRLPGEPSRPFYLPWESPEGAFADGRIVLDPPAGKHGPIEVRNGHLAFADIGRVRFWGVNLSGEGCFPPKEVAEKIADRLAKYGFGLVRLHGLDASWGKTIFDRSYKDTRHFDPEQLDRLDYLVAQLERRGIYINMNLHVGRRFTEADGVAQAGWLGYAKYCVIFDPRMIELQEEYARKLLGHRNPYTGKTYAEDPAVIVIEMTNENSLFGGWTRGFLRGEQRSRPRSSWTDIPPYYGEELTRFFNKWLIERYKTRSALARAWAEGARPAGPPMLTNGDFAGGAAGWDFYARKPARGRIEFVREAGRPCAKVTVEKVTGTRWHVMLTQRKLKLRKGEKYAVRFRVRASTPRKFSAEVCHDGRYRGYGSRSVEAGPEWREAGFTFVAPDDDDSVRLSFHFGEATGTVWLADVQMNTAAVYGLRDDEDPAKGTVRRLTPEEFGSVTAARFRDEGRFYYHLERSYYDRMYRLLKDELGVKALVEGTNHNYGLPCLWAESSLDLMDCHAYWQHPHFPRRPWSRTDWTIGNSPMLDEPRRSTVAALCRSSVVGKPFTVSEYNHPFPNEYECEAPLLIAAYGALQDWDAIYFYTFGHRWRERELGGNTVTGYFDVCNDVSKLAQMPTAALMFTRGDVRPAERLVTVTYDRDRLFDSLRERHRRGGLFLDGELSPLLPLVHRFRVKKFDAARTTRVGEIGFSEPKGRIVSDTGELVWDSPAAGQGRLAIDTPRTQAAVGWIGGKTVRTSDAVFEVKTPFCAVSLISLDGKPLRRSERILVVAAARCANTAMEWNAERTTISDRWGGPPILIEPVEGRILLARDAGAPNLRAVALDGRGVAIGKGRALEKRDTSVVIPLGGEPVTVWYGVFAGR